MRPPHPTHIRAAVEKIDSVFLRTPSFRAEALSSFLDLDLVLKDERVTPIGSFKGRGADLLVKAYPGGTSFVCASAGNFGQGMAYAASRQGSELTVFAAQTAARCKIEAMRVLGAEVWLAGHDFDGAKLRARQHATSTGELFVEDGAHAEIAEGAGTIALELTEEWGAFDAVYVPLGNGALAAGMGCWLAHVSPRTRFIAVAAERAPAMGLAVLGKPHQSAPCETIADGIAVRVPVPAAVDAVREVADEVIFVDEQIIRIAMELIENSTGRRVEAAGAVGLAGLLREHHRWRRKRVGIPICGGNRD